MRWNIHHLADVVTDFDDLRITGHPGTEPSAVRICAEFSLGAPMTAGSVKNDELIAVDVATRPRICPPNRAVR